MSNHKLSECPMCGEHIECGYCGNNCCNGGTGNLPDGSECGCQEAYNIQDEYFRMKKVNMDAINALTKKVLDESE